VLLYVDARSPRFFEPERQPPGRQVRQVSLALGRDTGRGRAGHLDRYLVGWL